MVVFVPAWTACALAQLPPTPDKSSAPRTAEPRAVAEKRTQDIGKLLEGDVVTVTWQIENRGSADLVIDRTGSACGCTVVKLADDEKTVRPGAKLDLKVEFNSTGRVGEQEKTIEVFSNDPLEPTLKLSFRALVEALYVAEPSHAVNLRVLRRGEPAAKPIELLPAPGRGDLTITRLEVERGAAIEATHQPYEKEGRKGAKILLRVSEEAALGPISASLTVDLRVGDIERQKLFSLRGEATGELTWLPKVIDATRQATVAGTTLSPVTVSSVEDRPFEIVAAEGGPNLQVTIGPGRKGKPKTEYLVQVALSETAPPGPFGTMLRIGTNSLDQPVIEVPVFGLVAPKIEVEPAVVLIRKDGTPAGAKRRVRIKTADTSTMKVLSATCESPAVRVTPQARAAHMAYIDAELTGDLPKGSHSSIIRIATDVPGADTIEVPVRIEIP